MSEFKFGDRSNKQLATCHKDLQLIAREALKSSFVDFGISEGHRSVEKQLEYFRNGASEKDGVLKKSKHNFTPSMAIDIFAYVPGPKKTELSFNATYLAFLGGVITSVAKRLLAKGKITHDIRWGYNWDGDGEIGTDQRFQDMPHFELVKT